MPREHSLPPFLEGRVPPLAYERWLEAKARAHSIRDRRRGSTAALRSLYKEAIHAAVFACNGHDDYTGEPLDWSLLGQYRNAESKAGRYKYKAKFALLPTVDHCGPSGTEASFCICGWRTNDAKNDLTLAEFLQLCERVIEHSRVKS